MSRELGPIELRVCRAVFAFLAVTVVAFLLLTAIESLFDPPASVNQAQTHPEITSSDGRNAEQPSQSSPAMQTLGAQSQQEPARAAVPDDAARLSLQKYASTLKVWSEPPEATTLERAIRFDPRPLERGLDGTSLAPSDAVPIPTLTETFQPQQEGTLVTANFASAEPLPLDLPQETNMLSQPPSPTTQREPKQASLSLASLTEEHVRQIQSRLRDLGFLSSANSGAWDGSSRDALRDFKVVNHLPHDDIWDQQTSEKLHSKTAIRADQSFIGRWSTTPCRSAKTKELRLSVNSRRARSSTGSVCEFHDLASDNRGWRVRTTCSEGDQRWTANGKFTLMDNKLVWTSERDVISYFRCN
jgi:hypothetical protein